MDENFQPLQDRVLVKRLPEPDKIGSIFLPGSAMPDTAVTGSMLARRTGGAKQHEAGCGQMGTVINVGPGRMMGGKDKPFWRRPVSVKPGDVVAFGQYFDAEDGDFLLIQEADIKGVVTGGTLKYFEKVSAPDEAA